MIFIAIPTVDARAHIRCVNGLLDACSRGGSVRVGWYRGSFLPHQRDLACHQFLESGADHLLMVDSDVAWGWADVELLLGIGEPFTFGRVVVKGAGTHNGVRRRQVEGFREEYDRCGAGFLLLAREVVERMSEDAPIYEILGEERASLWSARGFVERAGKLTAETEDIAFCRRWRELGGEIWTDTRTRLGHVGEAVYGVSEER